MCLCVCVLVSACADAWTDSVSVYVSVSACADAWTDSVAVYVSVSACADAWTDSVAVYVLVSACADAWTDSVALLHVDAASLINKHAHNIINQLTKSSDATTLSQVLLSLPSVQQSYLGFVLLFWQVFLLF